jgi:hypothetical protein
MSSCAGSWSRTRATAAASSARHLGRRPRPAVGARVIREAPGECVRRRLAAIGPRRREPARAEVDRVEHEHVAGDVLGGRVEEVQLGIEPSDAASVTSLLVWTNVSSRPGARRADCSLLRSRCAASPPPCARTLAREADRRMPAHDCVGHRCRLLQAEQVRAGRRGGTEHRRCATEAHDGEHARSFAGLRGTTGDPDSDTRTPAVASPDPCPIRRRSGNKKIQVAPSVTDGETRTRTGDTTIFSRAAATLERRRNGCKNAPFEPSAPAGKPADSGFYAPIRETRSASSPDRGARLTIASRCEMRSRGARERDTVAGGARSPHIQRRVVRL